LGSMVRSYWRVLIVLVVISSVLMPMLAQSASAGIIFDAGARNIGPGGYYLIKGFKAQQDAGCTFNVTVNHGPGVDVLLMEKTDYEAYRSGGPFSYLSASIINLPENLSKFSFTNLGDLTEGKEYYAVIDNTDQPIGGASPNGQEVSAFFTFGAGNVQVIFPGIDSMLIVVLVVATVAIILVLAFVLMRRKTSKAPIGPPGAYQTLPHYGTRKCPQCGNQAPQDHMFCPNCGWRF